MYKYFTPPLISSCILVLTICVMLLAENLNTKDNMAIPTMADTKGYEVDKTLNDSELLVLRALDLVGDSRQNFVEVSAKGKVAISNRETVGEYDTYKLQLKNYLEQRDVNLSDSTASKVVSKIAEFNAIVDMEKKSDIHKMSLDGRELAIRLTKEIYALCGLKLYYDMQGEIIKIADRTGENIFFKSGEDGVKVEFKAELFLIILGAIIFLILLSMNIAKKNQLFVKGVKYDGFNEKGYA